MDSNKHNFNHETVLLHQTIDHLNVKSNGIYVDGTLGGSGHARYILDKLDNGHLYAFDQDITAIQHAQIYLKEDIDAGKVTLIHANFRQMKEKLSQYGIVSVDGIYYDLGVSSPQLDVADRGFSYRKEARLDMRMDQSASLSAYEVINQWSYEELVRIFSRYGEERFSSRIARAIERYRAEKAIETTTELADIVKNAIPAATRRKGGHPATRTFQAIRIAVNDELGALEDSIEQGLNLLSVGGRMSVISFHSLEDRLVKQMFKEVSELPELPPNLPMIPDELKPDYKIINRRAIMADEIELKKNKRSRSARLRVIERLK